MRSLPPKPPNKHPWTIMSHIPSFLDTLQAGLSATGTYPHNGQSPPTTFSTTATRLDEISPPVNIRGVGNLLFPMENLPLFE